MNDQPRPTPTDSDHALRGTLGDVLAGGRRLGGMTEVLDYATGLTDPRARILSAPGRPFAPIGAIARFTWMVAGNDRLADIAYYEPKVAGYTDDGLTVPGSSYGRRLRQARPGLDQIAGAVERLRGNPDSRQAAAVVWSPEDAVRDSNDIPCAFGMFYRVRDDRVLATTVMRSNNAYRLLPLNVFEFTLLAEVVSAELDTDLGPYGHWASSMHVLDIELDKARAVLNAPPSTSAAMPPMPTSASPLAQARLLAVHEADLRHAESAGAALAVRDAAAADLHEYWLALFDALAVHTLVRTGAHDDAQGLADDLPAWMRGPVAATVRAAAQGREPEGQMSLIDATPSPTSPTSPASPAAAVRAAAAGDAARDLEAIVARIDDSQAPVSHVEFVELLDRLGGRGYSLAARSEYGEAAATDRTATEQEIRDLLAEIRSR